MEWASVKKIKKELYEGIAKFYKDAEEESRFVNSFEIDTFVFTFSNVCVVNNIMLNL